MQIAITEVVTKDEYDIGLAWRGAERRRSERGAGRRQKISSRHDDVDKPICFNTFSDGSFDDGSAQHRRGESFRLALGATNENIVRAAAVPGNLLSVAGIGAGLILAHLERFGQKSTLRPLASLRLPLSIEVLARKTSKGSDAET
jgi:hypothetical protein